MPWFYRHILVAVLSVMVSIPFYFGRMNWDPEMRLWRAIGDGSFVLLFATLFIGPLARHWGPGTRILPWRRELGIWYSVLAIIHTLLVLDGWVRWDWMRFFGFEFVIQFGRYARVEPGFGLSNLVGIVAVGISIVLLVTSSDWAVRRLGGSSWKWLHYGAYVVFYLVAIHSLYFLFMHYMESFHRRVPDDLNWFRYPLLVATTLVIGLQMSAFWVTVRGKRRNNRLPMNRATQ